MQSENKINKNVWCHVLIQMVHAKDFFGGREGGIQGNWQWM